MIQTFTDSVIVKAENVGGVIKSGWRHVPNAPKFKWSLEIRESKVQQNGSSVNCVPANDVDPVDRDKRPGVYIYVTGGPATVFGTFCVTEYCLDHTESFQFDFVDKGEHRLDSILDHSGRNVIRSRRYEALHCVITFMLNYRSKKAMPPVLLHEMLDPQEALTDAVVTVGRSNIKVNRDFLSIISPVFRAKFNPDTDTKELKTSVDIKGFSLETVKSAIDYCYGHVFKDKSATQVIEMIRFYEEFGIQAAIEKLEIWLAKNLSIENYALIADYAWKHSNEVLQTECGRFFFNNMLRIALDPNFIALDASLIGNIVKKGSLSQSV